MLAESNNLPFMPPEACRITEEKAFKPRKTPENNEILAQLANGKENDGPGYRGSEGGVRLFRIYKKYEWCLSRTK